jgi:hypothetical protein
MFTVETSKTGRKSFFHAVYDEDGISCGTAQSEKGEVFDVRASRVSTAELRAIVEAELAKVAS